jgi:type I restriction enzyme, S subunit
MKNKKDATTQQLVDKSALTPKLRFPEFRDAEGWEQKKLGEIASLFKGKGISKAEIATNGRHPCIRYGELYTRYGEVIDSVISRTNTAEGELFFSRSNDVIIPGSGETKLDIAKASCVLRNDVALGSDLNVIRTEHNGVFLSYYLNGPKKRDIAKVAQGDAVVHLYPSQLEKLAVALPKYPEQQKIAECLSSVDELIAAQAQKLDALKTHKNGLMQQLFPREGETQPRLRFPEFRQHWVETQLGNISSSISSGRDQIDLDGDFELYGSTSVIGKTKSPSFSGERILVARVGMNAGFLTKADGEFGVTDNTLVVSLNPSIQIDYIFYLLGNTNINRLIFGSGQPLITGSILKNLRVLLPTGSEQRKIATCLSSVDETINSQIDKLEALKTQKKALMQQLFPLPKEM